MKRTPTAIILAGLLFVACSDRGEIQPSVDAKGSEDAGALVLDVGVDEPPVIDGAVDGSDGDGGSSLDALDTGAPDADPPTEPRVVILMIGEGYGEGPGRSRCAVRTRRYGHPRPGAAPPPW